MRASHFLVTAAIAAATAAGGVFAIEESEFNPMEVRRILQHSAKELKFSDDSNAALNDPAAIELGKALFMSPRLSAKGDISCASCHIPGLGWQDGKIHHLNLHEGVKRNTPSLLNACFARWYYWDGRADTLWAQALDVFTSDNDFKTTHAALATAVADDPVLSGCYEKAFGTSRKPDPEIPQRSDSAQRVAVNLSKALAAFQCTLISTESPFDVFVEGLRTQDKQKMTALSTDARRGLKLFVGRGDCRTCHSGALFSDHEFHNIGIDERGANRDGGGRYAGLRDLLRSIYRADGAFSDAPNGSSARKAILVAPSTQQNRRQFKTPTLRNVELTPPYMHDGSLESLEDVLRHYRSPLGNQDEHGEAVLNPVALSDQDISDLTQFLKSLTSVSASYPKISPPDCRKSH